MTLYSVYNRDKIISRSGDLQSFQQNPISQVPLQYTLVGYDEDWLVIATEVGVLICYNEKSNVSFRIPPQVWIMNIKKVHFADYNNMIRA